MSDNIDRCHIIVLMHYLQAGWTHRERCKFFFENKNVQTILKHSFPYLMFILCWDVIFMMFILKIKLILEDFEDGSDQVAHNHKKVLLNQQGVLGICGYAPICCIELGDFYSLSSVSCVTLVWTIKCSSSSTRSSNDVDGYTPVWCVESVSCMNSARSSLLQWLFTAYFHIYHKPGKV